MIRTWISETITAQLAAAALLPPYSVRQCCRLEPDNTRGLGEYCHTTAVTP